MDDDGQPYNEFCFSATMKYIEDNSLDSNEAFFINSLVVNGNEKLSFGLKRIDEIEKVKTLSKDGEIIENLINPFNGSFISKGLIKKIGFPNKDFFIKGDEFDYNRRALDSGAKVFTLLSSRYFHPRLENVKIKKVFGRRVKIYIERPWKEYYAVRNYTYSSKMFHKYLEVILYLGLKLWCVISCKCNKCDTLKMVFKGFYDGIKGNLGKRVLPN